MRDAAILDQEIAFGEIADGGVDGDDRSVFDQRAVSRKPSDCGNLEFSLRMPRPRRACAR